jgi:lantibiotic biosynthesis protein
MTREWRALLTGEDAERARSVAREVATRLTTPELVERTLAAADRRLAEGGAQARGWSRAGLSGAGCCAALLCSQLDRSEPGAGWDRRGHAGLSAAAEAAGRGATPLGLYDGLAGLGCSAALLAGGRPRYGGMLASVDDVLTSATTPRCAALAKARGLPVADWDLISGITGVGVHLLGRREMPAQRDALERVLTALVALASDDGDDGAPPRWATPAEHLYPNLRELTPAGNVNCGLSHGVPGPLALMSLALEAGVEVPGQVDAVRRTADWLAAQALPGRFGPEWPAAVPLGDGDGALPPPRKHAAPALPGWCYGNAGVARAFWLSSRALGDSALAETAVDALRQALERQRAERPLGAPTLCHGTAGLAQVSLRIAAESGDPDVASGARDLCLELVHSFDADAPLGYRDVTAGRSEPRLAVDDPTLLAGAAGPALVLLAAADDHDPEWDRALLLS